jgi:hypothetical protein
MANKLKIQARDAVEEELEMVAIVARQIDEWAKQRGYGLYRVMRLLGYVTVACAGTIDLEGESD